MDIKFNGWHKGLKRMFTAEEMGVDQLTLMTDGRGFINVNSTHVKLSEIDNNKSMIPLLFTGKLDIENEEIYLEHIVIVPGIKRNPTVVKFQNGGFVTKGNGENCEPLGSFRNYKVIGNSFQNPELLT